MLITKRALSSVVSVLEYFAGLVDQAGQWVPAVAIVVLLLVGGVSLAIGASIGAAVAVHQLQQQER